MSAARRSAQPTELSSILEHGTGGADSVPARRMLGLEPEAEDKVFAQALVRAVAQAYLPELPQARSQRAAAAAGGEAQPAAILPTEPLGSAETVIAADGEGNIGRPSVPANASRSFKLRAPAVGPTPALSVDRLDDVRTLLLVVRAGSLFQRRASVRRIGQILQSGAPLTSDLRRQVLDTLGRLQHTELAHEIGELFSQLPGGEGRAARAEQRTRAERAEQVEARITAFWDGEDSAEPIASLNAEERAQLLARIRSLPDLLVRHIAALLEDAQSLGSDPRLRTLLGSLERCGDPRLLPALRSLLLLRDAQTFDPCVRAFASIEDPRVLPLLRDAYERTAPTRDRLVLAAALGRHGDGRGLGYAREVLAGGDPALLSAALEGLGDLGGGEDAQHLTELLEHGDDAVVHAAVSALGRIGDGRALVPLGALRTRVQRSAERAHIEDAELSIRARMELLGEEAPSQQAASLAWDTNKMVARARSRDPATVRVRARLYHVFAYLWLVCGATLRAIARFEAAAALRPEWNAPVLALALLYARLGQIPQALAAFRRAVDIDRYELEGDGHAITALAQTYLRRAEAMEREGRLDIARSLVEEVLGYDLRKAVPEVRFALQERLELQIARERGWKP
ncbi:MAG TPA: HEAT repeat domain-containing protein [Polyangiales bacterium]|nr:HEAT repeat domain-containing protein [Polyangiales bacterium]